MKHASLIAFISVAVLAVMQLYSIIHSITNEYWEYMETITKVCQILYFLAYCGIGYFFFTLFRRQR